VRIKLKYHVVCFLCLFVGTAYAQLTTSTSQSPSQLVQNVLLGSGVTATNITYTGSAQAIGSFNGVNSNIGFASGVLMTSGIPANAVGPNNQTGVNAVNNTNGDPDLDKIMAPTLSYDACIIEFDFIATADTLKFRYVFGSDEYMEYVSSTPGGINDGFGFFISGPGINGIYSNNSQNIAIIPGTSLPVTMFNLNLNNNGQYYVDNGNNGVNSTPGGATVQYDGFTKPLTATAILQCGKQYHIKLAIADGGDKIIDSGVFLEEGSFAINPNLSLTASNTFLGNQAPIDTVLYEGCGSVQIDLTRSGCNLPNAEIINYIISGTATNGTDYSNLTGGVSFAANVANGSITITSLADALIEGNETIVITFPGVDTLTFLIIDSPPLTVNLSNDTTIYCKMNNFQISANVSGGVSAGGYSYTWTNTTGTLTSAIVNPTTTTTYYLAVSDTCGNTAKDSVTVTVAPYVPMIFTLNPDSTICEGESVFLDANVINGAPGYTYTWIPNISSRDTATVSPITSTRYILKVTDVCGYTLFDTVDITVIPNKALFTYSEITNQLFQFTNLSSSNVVSYYWNFGDGSSDETSTNPDPNHMFPAGTYTVTFATTNSLGCTDTVYQILTFYPEFFFYFPNAFTPGGNGINDIYKGYGVGMREYSMQVFNRWGELIFETKDINIGWDGTYNKKMVEAGVYVVKFNVSGFKINEEKEYISHITVIR